MITFSSLISLPSSLLRRQLLPSYFKFNELDREKFSRCLLRVSAQKDSAPICLHSIAHEAAFKRSGRWLFFPLRVVSFLPADGFGSSLRNRFGTGFASCWATFFSRVVASFGQFALWSCIDKNLPLPFC